MVTLATSKGELRIRVFEQQTKTVAQFRRLFEAGAWAGCVFDFVCEAYVRLERPKDEAKREAAGEYIPERHPRLRFRRGTVALMPDFSVIITTQPGDPGVEASVVGEVDEESFWVVRKLSLVEAVDGVPLHKVVVEEHQEHQPQESQPQHPKKRIKNAKPPSPQHTKQSPSPKDTNQPPSDPLFARLMQFEAWLDLAGAL